MKKSRLILLNFLILLTLFCVFHKVLEVEFSHSNSIEEGLNTSDPAILEWSRFWGGDQYDTGRALITDSNENMIVVGQTSSFGSDYDLCLLKYSPSGEEIWNSTIIVEGNDWPIVGALDSLENIYVVVTVTSGTFPNVDQDMVLYKFNSSGNLKWQTTWGGNESDSGNEIVIDSFDNVYIAGSTESYGSGSSDAFIIKYDSTGAKLWESIWGGTDSEGCSKLALDSDENPYITGNTRIDSWNAIYLVKYNHSGSIIWERFWDRGFRSDISEDMIIDSSDNIYITGATTYWSSSDYSLILIKYNNSGEELWWKSWRAVVWDYDDLTGEMLVFDSEENIYIAGVCEYYLIGDDRDIFLLKTDSEGVEEWHHIWGGDNIDLVSNVFIDPSDDIILTGYTTSYGSDVFLLKYDKLGTSLGDLYWGGSNYITCWDTAIDNFGNIYATGEYDDLGPTNDELFIIKYDNAIPQIDIISPVQNQQYGNMTFDFNLTIVESNLEQTWYTLNDSVKFFFMGNIGVIDQNAWDMYDNGKISLKFYANDSIGNVGYAEVLIHKDFDLPFISIISPVSDNFYETDPPDYNISYGGNNINSTWYSLNNGPIHIFSGNSGTINISSWSSCLDGKVLIRFYINDSSGWYTFDQVIVNKDTLTPVINILDPTPNQICGYKAIDYSLEVIEVYLDSYWYTLDGGVTNITLNSFIGTIDQTEWNKHGNGTVIINFYANDSLGHLGNAQVTVRKEATPPLITIVSPNENDFFSIVAPTFELDIQEPDLDTTWYSLDDGATIFMFTGLTGSVDQTDWDEYGSGNITITFFANDSYGYESFAQVMVQKDIDAPIIIINSPANGSIFSTLAPDFDITVIDSQLDSIWYSIDDGLTNISISSTVGTISQIEWDKKGDGGIELRFYANDTLGNIAFLHTLITKDTIQPVIIINSPNAYELTGGLPPSFDISITEPNLDSMWYTLDDGATNISLFSLSSTIDQIEWNKLGNGTLIIKFYANDSVGHIGFSQVTILKDIIEPLISINSPTSAEIFWFDAPTFNISIIDPNLDVIWYTLDDGITNYFIASTTGTINQLEWDKFGNGTITLKFYANDSVGNEGMSQIVVNKDITAPLITINSPGQGTAFSSATPAFNITVIDSRLDSIWYTIDNGLTNISVTNLVGIINQIEWDKIGEENVSVRFYANDTLGNIDYLEVMIIKDTISPVITINGPHFHDIFGGIPPSFDLSVDEPHPHSLWYTLDGGVTNISLYSLSGTIDQTEWNKLGNGTVIIKFYTKDLADNSNFSKVTIFKDIIAPLITIHSPDNSEIFWYSAPEYNISINDPNLDLVWYNLDGGSTIFIVVSTTGTIDQTEWNKFSNGTITLTFGANDSIGNVGMSQIIIHKDIDAPYITINSPQQDEIFSLLPPAFDLTVIDLQLDLMWYTIDNGITNISILSTNGVINQNEWDKLDEGSISIRFYANDTLGNEAFSEVIITKDVFHGIDLVELHTPSTNSDINSNFIDFSWFSIDAVFGAVNFTLQVSNTSDFNYIIHQSGDITETPVLTNYSVQLSVMQGKFFWRVRPTFGRFNGTWSNYFLFTLHINNYAPNLVLNDFSPTEGTRFTIFSFTVIYTDLDDNAPDYVKIIINGIGFSMEMSNPSDPDFTDGCIYQYLTLLTPSATAYTISFECSDGAFYYATNTLIGPLVELEEPPDKEQGLDNLNSTNAMVMGISVVTGLGIVIPMVVVTEIKLKKHKTKSKQHSKIKK
jgi:hypothetical protein